MSRKMKDSCVPWVGDIPEKWSAQSVKNLVEPGKNGIKIGPFGSALKGKTLDAGPVKIYNQANLISEDFDVSRHFVSEETFKELSAYQVFPGDILFSMMGTIGKCCQMPANKQVGIMDSHLLKARLNSKILPEFFIYAFDKDRNPSTFDQLMLLSKGSIMNGLNSEIVRKVKIAVPPINEQHAIVSYLDSHCATIDSAISKHQQIIEKLEEYRKAVITQAVTNGLNPNVEMKDSGDSIIPIVPSHWLWTRVKFTVNVVRGGSPRPIEQYIIGEKEDGYNWIKIGDATGGGKFIIATKQRIKPDGLNKTRLVHAGTLLLTNSMSFGHPYFLQIDGCIHDGWLAFSDYKGVLPAFLYYYLMSETTAHQFTTTADGSVVQNLNIDKVRNSHIALPPIVEQKAIVQYLDTVDGKINTAIQHHNQIIEKLQEYKQSLIYNAVTGKIDCTTEA